MRAGKKGLGFALTAIGAGIGFIVGILTAPKSGKETRNDIKNSAKNMHHEAEKSLKQVHAEIAEHIEMAAKRAKTAGTKASGELDNLVKEATTAKQKVREVLSAIHEGSAEDKELQKALRYSNLALKNLKDYLSKN